MCVAEWDAYYACIGTNYDASTCDTDFHACDAQVSAYNMCASTALCWLHCDDPGSPTCKCTHECVGQDTAWTCQDQGNGSWMCDCSKNGMPVGSCEEQAGMCPFNAFCCLSL
jgi:hypothetical protein